MGVAIRTLLAQEFFKDFHLVAGKKGIDKEVQGVTVMDAPDAFRWTKGKELVVTSGYAISMEPDCIRKAFEERSVSQASGMMIKRDRYLRQIPQDIIELFEEHDIPLISMPFQIGWMDLMKEINTIVMNRTVRRFQIRREGSVYQAGTPYRALKIQRILQAVESEMNFPAFLYDIGGKENFYSSANFKRITESFGLIESDYWSPRQPYNQYTICDYIHMSRIRLVDESRPEGPRVSWILIPLLIGGVLQAYFVVMESREFLDYYDEYSIRIAYLMLQNVYEQVVIAQSMGNIGFENFVLFAVSAGDEDQESLIYQASQQGLSVNTRHVCILFRQTNPQIIARNKRKTCLQAFRNCELSRNARLAFLDENEGLILLEMLEKKRVEKEQLKQWILDFREQVRKKHPEMDLEFAVVQEGCQLLALRRNVEKCQRVMRMGKMLFPGRHIWDDGMVGPLAWLQIPEDELELLLHDYRELLKDEKNRELLKTLKVYLENNMNFSVTAEKLYVHVNTIRKRIDRVSQLLSADWNSGLARLQTEILLQYLGLEE